MVATSLIPSKTHSTKQELIAANIKLLIEQLDAGHSDALTNYLTAMSRFHHYSFGNVLEIARQMPTATRVAGFWTWKNLGRSVNAGAKGIRILAPIVGVRRKKDSEAEKDITKQNTRTLLGFRNTYVFDVSQINGVDLPEMHEISGDPGENVDRLAAFVKAQGIQLVYNPKPGSASVAERMTAWITCKSAVLGLARGLAEIAAGTAVTVNAFIPGPSPSEEALVSHGALKPGRTFRDFEKEFIEGPGMSSVVHRFLRPEEIADLVVFLASDQSSGITGAALRVDGGIIRSIL